MRGFWTVFVFLMLAVPLALKSADNTESMNGELSELLEMLDFYVMAQDPVANTLRRIRKEAEAGKHVETALNHSIPSSSLENDFAHVLAAVREKSPVLAKKLDSMPRREALERLLSAVESGVVFSDSKAAEITPPKRFTAVRRLRGNRILYIRVDSLEVPQSETLEVYMKREREFARGFAGLILDLRNASGADYTEVTAFEKLFGDADFTGIPKIVMIGGKTCGAPELLAARLANDMKAVTMGEKGSNRLFPMASGKTGDFELMIPVMDEMSSSISPADSNVLIKTEAYPQIDFALLSDVNIPSLVKTDPCLLRAMDLAIAIAGTKKIYGE